MTKINSKNVSQIARELSSIDVQEMLMARAKNAVLATAIELMSQDMERLCEKPLLERTTSFVTEAVAR